MSPIDLLILLCICVLIWIICNAIIPSINVGTNEQPRTLPLGPIIALLLILAYLTGGWAFHAYRVW